MPARGAQEEVPAYLNRLAGTTGLDAAGAANAVAGTSGLELVGALNAAAGTTLLEYQAALDALSSGSGGGGGGSGGVTDRVVVTRTATSSANAATWLDVAFDTEVVDASNYWVVGTPQRVTVPTGKAGYHFFSYMWNISQSVDAARAMAELRVFNSSNTQIANIRQPIGQNWDGSTISAFKYLADGDYVTSHIYRSNASITTTASGIRLEVVRFV